MIDFGKKEINKLEELFSDIEAFICSFHSEKVRTKWTNNVENRMSHIANIVKCRVHRIVYGNSGENFHKSIGVFYHGNISVGN